MSLANILRGVQIGEQVAEALLRLYHLVEGDRHPAASLHALASTEELRRKADTATRGMLERKFGKAKKGKAK